MNLLQLNNICVRYGDVEVIRDLSLAVEDGTITSLVGSNGAGKSSLLKAISGIIPSSKGNILFEGQDITHLPPHLRVNLGIIQIPEGRHIFPYMNVLENLELGSISPRAKANRKENLDKVFSIFPRLGERKKQLAGTLSGGEQQMLAIARGLMSNPRLLMLDEPSLGLAPIIVKEIFFNLLEIHKSGITILLVEQDVKSSLDIADKGYVLENGRVVMSGLAKEILASDKIRKAYLGM
uniref:ABC transporter ATP-binding protein n=1 Tax=Fervidicoccus fontis TaxID=683846 RepID=A0A7J3SMB9_9CREN